MSIFVLQKYCVDETASKTRKILAVYSFSSLLTNKKKHDKKKRGAIMIDKTIVELPRHKDIVTWSHSFSVGIKIIDEQHKELLDFVNDMFNHSTGNEEEELKYFKEVIHVAVDYIKKHFSTEEQLLAAANYPNLAGHKKAHETFTLEVVKSAKDFESGKRLVLEKYAYYLKDWILTHIAVMDKQYSAYFKNLQQNA
jgi:hemerythrin